MRIQSIRFTERQWALILEQAAAEGSSASQYVREAALMRLAYEHGSGERLQVRLYEPDEGALLKRAEDDVTPT